MAGKFHSSEGVLKRWSEGCWSFLSLPQWATYAACLVRDVAEERWQPEWQRLTAGRDFVVLAPLGREGRGIVRPYRRGGWMRLLTDQTYWGLQPRSFHELRCLVELTQRGVPVAPPIAAAVRWKGWWRYQAWLVTGFLEGSVTLWQWLRSPLALAERELVLSAVARALVQLHRAGGVHRDLNLNNILVRVAGEAPEVWFIDFDAAKIHATPTDPKHSLGRLRRSARRLDPKGSYGASHAVELVRTFVHELWPET